MADLLLKQDGDLLLLETGSAILLEETVVAPESTPFVNRSRIAIPVSLTAANVPYAASDVPTKIRVVGNTDLLPYINSSGSNLILTDDAGTIMPFEAGIARIVERGEFGWSIAQFGNARAIGDLRVLGYYDIPNGDWRVGAWNVSTQTWTSTKLLDAPAAQKDDHNNPSIEYDSLGYIYAFCAEHNTSRLRVFKSNSPNSIAAFTQVANLDGLSGSLKSYAMSACFREFDDLLCLSYRSFGVSPHATRLITFSDDGGITWTTSVVLIDQTGQRAYPQMVADQTNGRLHFVFSPGGWTEIADNLASIYHFYINIDVSPKTLHESDGAPIGDIGSTTISSANATLADSASTRGFYMWPADCDIDEDGNPISVHSEISSASPNYPFDLRIRYAKLIGGVWESNEVLAEGQSIQLQSIQPFGGYFRGAALLNSNTLFVFADDANKRLQGYKLTTADNGATWATEIGFTPIRDAFRCVAFRGATSGDACQMAYMSGYYKEYQYNTGTYNGIPAGTQPRSKCDIALWPLAGTEVDIAIVTELDFDGLTDTTLYLQAGGVAYVPTAPVALLAMHGEVGGTRVSTSNTLMNGLAACTVLVAFNLRNADTQPKTIASDYSTDGADLTNNHILLRLGSSANSRRVEVFWIGPSSTSASRLSTTLNATVGQNSALAARFNGTANLALALDGSALDASGTSALAALNNAAAANALRIGETRHAANAWFDGWVQDWMVFNTAKTDAWMRAATIVMRGELQTLGTPEFSTATGGSSRVLGLGGPCIGVIDE